jgi:hypothetical protein
MKISFIIQPYKFVLNVNLFLQLTCKHTDALTLIQYKTVILLFNILLLMDQVFLGYVLLTYDI